jgi:hypothetical protein
MTLIALAYVVILLADVLVILDLFYTISNMQNSPQGKFFGQFIYNIFLHVYKIFLNFYMKKI